MTNSDKEEFTPGERIVGADPTPAHETVPTHQEDALAEVNAIEEISASESSLFGAQERLRTEIDDALKGKKPEIEVAAERLLALCKIIDFWLSEEHSEIIESVGLIPLAAEIKKDYVLASFLAWRGELKLAYISLRSFLESFCLLLYYLNQGCDRLLYLKGKGYKLMLHRMVQKRNPEDEHAFRRHYHLLLSSDAGGEKYANKFFDEVDSCYSFLSKAVHGNYSPGGGKTVGNEFLDTIARVLRICNTLALHDPLLDATDDDLDQVAKEVLAPTTFAVGNGK